MKLVVTALVIIGVLYGVVQFAMAGHGWFQMSGVVDEVAEKELPALIERVKQQGGMPAASGSEGYVKMRDGIMKGAEEARVPLRPDDVSIGVIDNMLEVRLAWDAPIIVYDGKPYVEIPLSMQRRFSLAPRRGY